MIFVGQKEETLNPIFEIYDKETLITGGVIIIIIILLMIFLFWLTKGNDGNRAKKDDAS